MNNAILTDKNKSFIKPETRRNRTVKSVVVPLVPESPERELKRIYGAYCRLATAEIKKCYPQIKSAYKQYTRTDGVGDYVANIGFNAIDVIDRVQKKIKKTNLAQRIVKVANQTKNHSKSRWQIQAEATLGYDAFKDLYDEDFYREFVDRFVLANKSLTTDLINKMCLTTEKRIRDAYSNGLNISKMIRQIDTELKNAKYRTGMTARDQVGSLNAEIVKEQCRKAGVTSYIWHTENDTRVRECHRSFNGRQFYFNEPPATWYRTKKGIKYTGRRCNPGEDYACRCVAVPVFNMDNEL